MLKYTMIMLAILILASVPLSQEASRDDKIRKVHELRSQLSALESEILLPDASDIEAAHKVGASALRLLPRELYDGVLTIRGGGSYYSFTRKTHEYGYGSDIELQRGRLSVGFAGADYGFITDLGTVALSSVSLDSPELSFLANYKPPTEIGEIRREQSRSRSYETPLATLTRDEAAKVGRAYALRSIGFDKTDVLVTFRIVRKDADGSLILHWKLLRAFEKPTIAREAEKN